MDNTQDLCNIEDSGDAGRERSPEHCSSSTAVDSGYRLFDRQRSIRQIMGGGKGNNTTVFSVLAWALLKPGFCKHEGRLKFDVNLENKESLLSLSSFLYVFLAYISKRFLTYHFHFTFLFFLCIGFETIHQLLMLSCGNAEAYLLELLLLLLLHGSYMNGQGYHSYQFLQTYCWF